MGKAGEGLEDIVAGESAISSVDGQVGKLLYRGYDIRDLAEHSGFEEVCHLLWRGELPARKELDELRLHLRQEMALPPGVLDVLARMARRAEPMDALRTSVSALSTFDPPPTQTTRDANYPLALRLVARTPSIVAAYHRLRNGLEPVSPTPGLSLAENFLRMLNDKPPGPRTSRAMDVALVLHADHEFNASTFTARVIASTLADMYSATTGALGALKGPLHGGANTAVMQSLKEIHGVSDVEPWVKGQLGQKKKIFGFGHRVYKTMDPRAVVLKKLSQEVAREVGDTRWFDVSAKMEQVVLKEKQLNPNVDFYSASLYHVMGFPDDLFTPIFAVSRMSGWTAHILEQYGDNRLIRPRAEYTGPAERKYPARPA
ncbi:MAG: citrate synthase [Halobacteriales archaeon]|nr:citrate synthase [Halobacteriales archaeon]